ncbi:MAG TPA: ATP-binding protein [Chitinispirillaceae bacterium]|nr:ATP-binding protein [Chitinispirillaceae bacterium]
MLESLQIVIIIVIICCIAILLGIAIFQKYKKAPEDIEDDPLSSKTIEEQLIISKRELETVFDAITDLILIIDKNYRIVRVNQSCASFLKKPIRMLLGQPCYKVLWDRNEMCEDCSLKRTFTTGATVSCRRIKKLTAEGVYYYEIQTYPVFDENKKPVHVIEFIRDITNEKRMNDQLIRSEKLAGIGIMTSGIAHEINNPLSAISGTAVNLLEMPEKYGLNEKGLSRVSTILELADRATAIMRDLLHLSRDHEKTSSLVNVNKLVENTIKAVHLGNVNKIEKRFNLDPHVLPINCDPSKIEQVIMNLTTNAIQSIQQKLAICQAENREFFGSLNVATQFRQGGGVAISITDNGVGIPDANRSRIFVPFFSTQPTGKGTGLGLSICHRIVEEHGGTIYFESENDRTMFVIELPFERKNSFKIIQATAGE